jgi:signal peptidase I
MEFQVTVPAGKIFVMGDHRSASGDSRVHLSDTGPGGGSPGDAAFVPMDKVTGRAILVVWPANRFANLGVPDTFKSVPPPGPAPDKPSISLTPPPK